MKQPSAMCCPLSGGGDGSPSRSGSVCTAPPSVGRASYSVTSWPASTRSSAAAQPGEAAADDRGLHRRRPLADDPELRERRQLRRPVEDVVAARLDPVERRAVEAGERRDAERAAGVERAQQAEPVLQVGARTLGLERHQRAPRSGRVPGGDVVFRHAERGSSSCGQVDASELPVLTHIANDVDQLQRDAERLGALDVVGAVHGDAGRRRPRRRPSCSSRAARRSSRSATARDPAGRRRRAHASASSGIGKRVRASASATSIASSPGSASRAARSSSSRRALLRAAAARRPRCRRRGARTRRSQRWRGASPAAAP